MDSKRKRRRGQRRRLDCVAVSASLLLDERMNGEDVGLVSQDLFQSLFQSKAESDDQRYVAITPWVSTSQAKTRNLKWTIIPVKIDPKPETATAEAPHSSVRIPATSAALPYFTRLLRYASSGKTHVKKDTPYEIRVVAVIPPRLHTVYVTLNYDAMLKHYESQLRFGGGFKVSGKESSLKYRVLNGGVSGQKTNTQVDEKEMESSCRQAVRESLGSRMIYTGDYIHLPLPAHPISHTLAPPVKITACEPNFQGICHSATRIVLIKSHERRNAKPQIHSTSSTFSYGIPEEDEDTGNEQFYSATEERSSMNVSSAPEEDTTDVSDTQSIMTIDTIDQEDLSDDPEDIIALSTPMLPPQTSGILSGFAGATPRAGGYHSGNIGSPGSAHSGFSSSTILGGSSKGRVFKTQGMMQTIPDDILHPRPSPEEDEVSRIFVDTSALVKIACFSGDWVRIETAQEPGSTGIGFAPWTLDAFQDGYESTAQWRPVKVYALPDIRRHSSKPGTQKLNRQTSFGFGGSISTPTVYLPPLLKANLSNSPYIRISPLSTHMQNQNMGSSVNSSVRITSSSMPPAANEVKILKILTPISQDIKLQPMLFAALKDYFEEKKRILKTDDLIAITFDEFTGRMMYQPGNDSINDELSWMIKQRRTNLASNPNSERTHPPAVAWFKVATVAPESSSDESTSDWGGVAYVASSYTKLIQKANEPARLPSTIHGTWQYYYGMRNSPASSPIRLASITAPPEPYISEMRRRLRGLISAATSPQAIHVKLEPMAILLSSSKRWIGKSFTLQRACEDLGLHYSEISAYGTSTPDTAAEIEEWVKQRSQRLLTCGSENTVLCFKHIDVFPGDRMFSVFKDILAESRVIVATSTDVDKIPEGIRSLFTHELEFNAPDEGEREGILRGIVDDFGVRLAPDVELSSVALKTAALVALDLKDVVKRATTAQAFRLEKVAKEASDSNDKSPVTIWDLEVAGGPAINCLTKSDFENAVDAARKNFADAIGAPKIPNVGWDDVGGLAHVKEAVMETIQLPLTRPELFAKGMKKRSGILFYGPPGTGKTLLAKAIATEFSLNFFSVKGPELLNMYIGESEANVRRVFQRARDARPCVVFFDELDSVAPKRGNQGDSGGVMDRIVSQLLAELDGMSNGEEGGSGSGGGGVFVIGATNRPDLLDQALLRPGRFDKMLYLGISDSHDKQLKILEALTRKFSLHPSCSLRRVSETIPFTYTGADLYALCSDAMLKAITRQTRKVDEKVAAHNASLKPGQHSITIAQFFDHYATEDDLNVTVTEADFYVARKELIPSVSADELGHYERVRNAFESNDSDPTPAKAAASAPKVQAPTQPPSNPPRQHQLSLPSRQRPLSDTSSTLKSPLTPLSPLSPSGQRPVSQRVNSSKSVTKRSDRSTFYFEQGANDDEEEDYVIRTDHLHSNGIGNGDAFSRSSSRRGENPSIRGRTKPTSGKFGSATDGDEDMYR